MEVTTGKKMKLYKAWRILPIGKKAKWVTVDENGKVINGDPSKEELKGLGKFPEKDGRIRPRQGFIAKEQILGAIVQFYEHNRRVPVADDFRYSFELPGIGTVQRYLGSLNNAIREAGLVVNRDMTDEELLVCLRQFERENGRSPTWKDIFNDPMYPCLTTYTRHFGSLEKAKKLVEQDIDSLVRKGILSHKCYRARLAEILVLEHFTEEGYVDLSGDNRNSVIDGICPNDQMYDVKSACLRYKSWHFATDKEEGVDFYYLLAFNGDWTKLLHVWRIHWNFLDKKSLTIGIDSGHNYNLENMKKYEITEKFIDVFNSWMDGIQKWVLARYD